MSHIEVKFFLHSSCWTFSPGLVGCQEKKLRSTFDCIPLANFSLNLFFSFRDFISYCLKRNQHVTVLYKQKSNEVEGDFLGRLVLGVEEEKVKIFGATIF